MKILLIAARNLLFMTLIFGGIYPTLITFLGKTFFPIRSQGSLHYVDGKVIGSELIAQKFTQDKYFWPRPSAIDFKAEAGGATQRSGTNNLLKLSYEENKRLYGDEAPADMLYASASGLDPHISVEAANFQKNRVLMSRKIAKAELEKFIKIATEERFLGFMGQPRVNVLTLNQLIDRQ